jgi:oligopeptide/dipeptide ABC transporter ATP-binding protein
VSILLKIRDLQVSFKTNGGEIKAVRGVSLDIKAGEILAVVGESGCGKSVTAQAIMGMIPKPNGRIHKGSIQFKGQEITKLSKKELQKIRGIEIGMIFQDPMTALNPTMKVGPQIREIFIKKQNASKIVAKEKSIELLKLVGIADSETRYSDYPHTFSGGMRQRIVIAMALACNPSLIIADEPTTALDVTIQAQILDLLKKVQREGDSAIMLITHDLGVVAEVADRVAVMYAGVVVETGSVYELFDNPRHPYTRGLLQSVPKLTNNSQERLIPIDGSPPDLFFPPAGCPFAERCPFAMEVCIENMPPTRHFTPLHEASCWLNDERSPLHTEWTTKEGVQIG